MRPAERTLQWCRRRGALAGMTERWNPHAGPIGRDGARIGVRQDLWGLVDVLALWPKRADFLQACGVDVAAHITKIRSSVELGARLASILADHPRRRFFIIGWRRRQLKHQKRPEWVMRVVEARTEMTPVNVSIGPDGNVRSVWFRDGGTIHRTGYVDSALVFDEIDAEQYLASLNGNEP